jgi:hypothetical protein
MQNTVQNKTPQYNNIILSWQAGLYLVSLPSCQPSIKCLQVSPELHPACI